MRFQPFQKIKGHWKRGWLFSKSVRHCASPNFNLRPQKTKIDLIVVHYISLPENNFSSKNILKFFQNKLVHFDLKETPFLKVSAHFYIARNGKITQFVSVFNRAWHAGESYFNGRENCNDFSIGIELAGSNEKTFTAKQYFYLNELLKNIQKEIPFFHITGHCDIAPQRKIDPGPFFDYQKLVFPR